MSPVTRPTVGAFAERIYQAMLPIANNDEPYGWPLLCYLAGMGDVYFEPVEQLVRDTDAGPGWSALVDIERCPDFALPWLAQLVGVRVDAGADPATIRALIDAHVNFRRGSPEAIRRAAQTTLIGTKTVFLTERDGSPYRLTVGTYDAETPDPAATEAAIRSQKPAGIVLNYVLRAGQTWQHLRDTRSDWQDVKTTYGDWEDVRANTP